MRRPGGCEEFLSALGELQAGSLEEAAALQGRAQALAELRGAKMGTTSVMRVQNRITGDAQTWIAIETDQLTAPARWTGKLLPGEQFIPGAGHAEQTILSNLGKDWYVVSGGTSRNVCLETCQPLLEGHGLQLGGPEFQPHAVWNSDFRMFWRP